MMLEDESPFLRPHNVFGANDTLHCFCQISWSAIIIIFEPQKPRREVCQVVQGNLTFV